jgi:glycerol-3-phosphate acyltransferase PlsY
MTWAAFILAAFLSGSIPFGLLIARAKGIDIRAHGSKNIGATNVGRVLGRRWGLFCLMLDALKAFIPVALCGLHFDLWGDLAPPLRETMLWSLTVAAAVCGHIFSPWVGFKGGKGVASGLGAMLGFFPLLTFPAVGALLVFLVALKTWRYVSLASILASLSIPVLACITPLVMVGAPGLRSSHPDSRAWWGVAACAGILAVLVIFRHRTNLARLRAGTEPKVARRTG